MKFNAPLPPFDGEALAVASTHTRTHKGRTITRHGRGTSRTRQSHGVTGFRPSELPPPGTSPGIPPSLLPAYDRCPQARGRRPPLSAMSASSGLGPAVDVVAPAGMLPTGACSLAAAARGSVRGSTPRRSRTRVFCCLMARAEGSLVASQARMLASHFGRGSVLPGGRGCCSVVGVEEEAEEEVVVEDVETEGDVEVRRAMPGLGDVADQRDAEGIMCVRAVRPPPPTERCLLAGRAHGWRAKTEPGK